MDTIDCTEDRIQRLILAAPSLQLLEASVVVSDPTSRVPCCATSHRFRLFDFVGYERVTATFLL